MRARGSARRVPLDDPLIGTGGEELVATGGRTVFELG
jgi:hypothetical protein